MTTTHDSIKTVVNKILFLIVIIFFFRNGLYGQEKRVPIMSSTKEGVHIFIRGKYLSYSGFKVYRKETGFGKDYQLLTKQPVHEVNSVYEAQDILGANWDYLKDFLDTQNAQKLLMRMKSPDVATILRYCGVPFAKVLGRYYFDQTAQWGEKYRYKVVLLDNRDNELETIEVKYTVDDELPTHQTELTYKQEKDRIHLFWDAPEYKEKADNDFVGFNLYRKYKNKEQRLNFLPVLRRPKIVWIDRTAHEERTYEYVIKPVDILGREGRLSARKEIYVKDLIPPLVPQGLTATKGNEVITLKWNKGIAKDIVEYKLFRAPSLNADYYEINTVSNDRRYYADQEILGGKPYFYKIQAVDNVGNNSLISTAVYAVASDSTGPEPPLTIEYEFTDNEQVLLDWTPSPSRDLLGYFVYRGYKGDKAVKLTPKSIEQTEFIDEQAFNPGHTYFYYVSAIDLSFNQSDKQAVKIQIPDNRPPRAPKNCSRATTKEGYVAFSWHPSMSLDVMSYRIYRKAGRDKKLLATLPADPYSYVDSTVQKGMKYIYSITAIDSFENESDEVVSPPITPTDIMPPPAPYELEFQVEKRYVAITWQCDPVVDLKGYNVYRKESKYGDMKKVNRELISEKRFVDKTGKKGAYYKVTTFDSSQNETASKIKKAR